MPVSSTEPCMTDIRQAAANEKYLWRSLETKLNRPVCPSSLYTAPTHLVLTVCTTIGAFITGMSDGKCPAVITSATLLRKAGDGLLRTTNSQL